MAEEKRQPRTLKVTGRAEIKTTPDVCYMCFSVETENKNASRAYHENNRKMNEVIGKITGEGIPDKDIKTANFSIFPSYKTAGSSTRQAIEAYRIFHYLYVAIEDLDKVSACLDAAVAAGATGIHSINYTLKNPAKYTEDARIKALLDAKTRAEKTAATLGFKLGVPLSISDSESGQQRYRAAPVQASLAEADTYASGKQANLQPGEVAWNYTVYVTYEIEVD